MLWKAKADAIWATTRDTAMASQTEKLRAVNIKMFSVNDLKNCYNLYLNDKLNFSKGLL